MKKWFCTLCRYIYYPAKGTPEKGIIPGTPFEKVPDTWACPECGTAKTAFKKI
jgi:rubredoxin